MRLLQCVCLIPGVLPLQERCTQLSPLLCLRRQPSFQCCRYGSGASVCILKHQVQHKSRGNRANLTHKDELEGSTKAVYTRSACTTLAI